jgi:hypothetical protein
VTQGPGSVAAWNPVLEALDRPVNLGRSRRRTGDKLRNAPKDATDAGVIVRNDDGLYERTESA